MRKHTQLIGIGLAVTVAYVVAARLGFRIALVAEQVTTVWAPTGIAQAALILWGLRLWPAVWAGAFLANLLTNVPFVFAAGIASGNTLEAVAAAWLLARVGGFDPALRRVRDAILFIVVAAVLSTVLSATIGTTMLALGGLQPWSRYAIIWPDWWLGDALGSLIVAPVLMTLVRTRPSLTARQAWESAGWLGVAMGVTALVFGPMFSPITARLPLAFIVFPFVITAAVRLGQPATALVLLGTAAVTVANTILGYGPFVNNPLHDRLVLAQVFSGVLACSGMLLSAALTERRTAERRRTAAYAVGASLARSTTLDEAASEILRVIGESLGWQVGGLWLVDGELLRNIAVWTRAPSTAPEFVELTRRTTFPSGRGLPGRVWETGHPAWIEDVVDDRNFPRAPIARKEGLHGAFAFPICLGDQFLGVVEFFNTTVSSPDDDLLETMGIVGAEIGQFIGRLSVKRAASDAQRRTRAILETALDAIISIDHHGRITEFNAAAERMFGHAREAVVGRELAEVVIPPELRNAHRGGLENFLLTGHGPFIDRRVETRAVRADGTEFPVEVSITQVPTDPPMFTGYVRDTTERVRAERAHQELLERELVARQEAEAANRAKDEFLATLSHELRTPLNAIVGWTRMLLDGSLDPSSTRRALEIIDRNAQSQAQLVGDILDVSRIITGKLRLDVQPVDLGSVIGTVLDGVRPAADAKRIRMRSTLAAGARVTRGDPQRLQQIVWNLVSNALKFTPEGGEVDVELAQAGPGAVRLSVADSGKGIAPEFLGRIFDRFSQADSSSTREHGGLGLGLAIVRHLVELHGGTVRAASKGVDQGATFVIELPVQQAESDAAARDRDDRAATAAAANGRLTGCRVLLVEDDNDSRDLIATVLRRAGAAVEEAATVRAALELLERSQPDVLLSDIGFPGENGYELIQEVRRREKGSDRRIAAAAVTAYARAEDRRKSVEAGFDQFIPKPIQPSSVVEAVRTLWQSRG